MRQSWWLHSTVILLKVTALYPWTAFYVHFNSIIFYQKTWRDIPRLENFPVEKLGKFWAPKMKITVIINHCKWKGILEFTVKRWGKTLYKSGIAINTLMRQENQICNYHRRIGSHEISTVDARIIWSKYLSCSGNFKV